MKDIKYAIEELDWPSLCKFIQAKIGGDEVRFEIMRGEVGSVKTGYESDTKLLFTFSSFQSLQDDLYDFFSMERGQVSLTGASKEQNAFISRIADKVVAFRLFHKESPQAIILGKSQYSYYYQIAITVGMLNPDVVKDKVLTYVGIPVIRTIKPSTVIEVY